MEQKDIAVGLDIGTTKIVAMIGRYNDYHTLEILVIGNSINLIFFLWIISKKKSIFFILSRHSKDIANLFFITFYKQFNSV